MPIHPPETHPSPLAVSDHLLQRPPPWIEGGLALADNPNLIWACRILDISSRSCALYCEEPTPQLAAVLLTLPGLDDSIIGRIVADQGFVKHVSLALPLDLSKLILPSRDGS